MQQSPQQRESRLAVFIDHRNPKLVYFPIIHAGAPYIYIGYLHHTALWDGHADTGEDTISIAYQDRTAVIHRSTVTISNHENALLYANNKAARQLHGRVYLHFQAFATLTGDDIRWDNKHQRLKIKTMPDVPGCVYPDDKDY